MAAPTQQPYLNTREGSSFKFLGIPTLIRATHESTNGAFGLVEQWAMAPGFASPYHVHRAEDESFYILEGEVAFLCGDQWLRAMPGTFVFGPRDVPHGFRVEGKAPARILLACTPGGGFERFVAELGEAGDAPPSEPDIPKLIAVAAKYKIDILGPLPERM